MNTPITDAATLNRWDDSCPLQVVPKSMAVALEADRAALMAIAERAAALATHQDCDPDHHSLVIDSMAALAAARANFPTP